MTQDSLLTQEEFDKQHPGMDYEVYLNTEGRWIVFDNLHNHNSYFAGCDPYEESGVTIKPASHVESLPYPELIEQMLSYYPSPKATTLQELYERFEDRLSEEDKLKLKTLL